MSRIPFPLDLWYNVNMSVYGIYVCVSLQMYAFELLNTYTRTY